jgi:hypothetical protein
MCPITNPPKLDNKPPVTPVQLCCAAEVAEHKGYSGFRVYNKTGDGDTRRKILTEGEGFTFR